MLGKKEKGQIATEIVEYYGEAEMLRNVNRGLLSRKAESIEKLTGVSKGEYMEYAMEMLELITGFELNIPGIFRENRTLLSEERRGEISLLVVKRSLFVKMSFSDINRRIGNIAAATGIAREDIEEFAREVISEAVEEGIAQIGRNNKGKTRFKGKF